MGLKLPGTKERKALWSAWTLNAGFSVAQVICLALSYKHSQVRGVEIAFTLRVLFLCLLGTIIMTSILLFSSLVILLGKDFFKHSMSASFRVGCTVGANVTAFIVLVYTGAICAFLAAVDVDSKYGYRVSNVLSYISAVTHFLFGVALFFYREHVVPGNAAISPEDSADLVSGGASSSVVGLPPPAPYTPVEPPKPAVSAFASSGQTANPWG